MACKLEDIEIIKLLLSHSCIDVNTPNIISPLMHSIYRLNIEILELLLNHPHIDVNQTIDYENYYPHSAITTLSTHYSFSCIKDNHNELKFIECAKLLLSSKNFDLQSKQVGQALFLFAQNNSYGLVELLLEKGVHPNTPNYDDNSPLLIAAEKGHIEIVKLLLNHKKIELKLRNSEK